jgi:tetratricopeptide (TPR) repeat protein
LRLDPDFPEAYRLRAYIRNALRQNDAFRADVQRYDLLTRQLGKIPGWRLRLVPLYGQVADRESWLASGLAAPDLPQRLLSADPEDVDLMTALAENLHVQGRRDEALAAYNQVLETNPEHLRARYSRGVLLFALHRGEGAADLGYLVEHPRFEEFVRETSVAIQAFYLNSFQLLRIGAVDRALEMAGRGLSYAERVHDVQWLGRMHYALACAYARQAATAPEQLHQAAAHLLMASEYDRAYLDDRRFLGDRSFDGQRAAIALLIAQQH